MKENTDRVVNWSAKKKKEKTRKEQGWKIMLVNCNGLSFNNSALSWQIITAENE